MPASGKYQPTSTFSPTRPSTPTAHIALAAMSAHQLNPACGPIHAVWLMSRAGWDATGCGSRSAGCMACRSHSHLHSAAASRALHGCHLHDGNGSGDNEGGTVQNTEEVSRGDLKFTPSREDGVRLEGGGLSSISGCPCPGPLSSTSSVVPENASKLYVGSCTAALLALSYRTANPKHLPYRIGTRMAHTGTRRSIHSEHSRVFSKQREPSVSKYYRSSELPYPDWYSEPVKS